MAILPEVCDQLALKFEVLLPHLNERQRRLLLAAEARLLGHGGVRAVARLAGVQLVITDAHAGLKNAIASVLLGASWQRCRVH